MAFSPPPAPSDPNVDDVQATFWEKLKITDDTPRPGLAVTVTADWVIFDLASTTAASEMLTFVPTARTDSRCDPLVAR